MKKNQIFITACQALSRSTVRYYLPRDRDLFLKEKHEIDLILYSDDYKKAVETLTQFGWTNAMPGSRSPYHHFLINIDQGHCKIIDIQSPHCVQRIDEKKSYLLKAQYFNEESIDLINEIKFLNSQNSYDLYRAHLQFEKDVILPHHLAYLKNHFETTEFTPLNSTYLEQNFEKQDIVFKDSLLYPRYFFTVSCKSPEQLSTLKKYGHKFTIIDTDEIAALKRTLKSLIKKRSAVYIFHNKKMKPPWWTKLFAPKTIEGENLVESIFFEVYR